MKQWRDVLIVDAVEDESSRIFREVVFADDKWRVSVVNNEKEAVKRFAKDYDIDIIIAAYDIGEGNSINFLETVRNLDINVSIFLMDEDPRSTFSAYDSHRLDAMPFFIHKPELLNNPLVIGNQLLEHYDERVARLCKPQMFSEYGRLRSVLVHEPSEEIDRIDPDHLEHYLFESLPSKQMMQKQHQKFVKTMKKMGHRPLVLDVKLLMHDVIRASEPQQLRSIVKNSLLTDVLFDVYRRFERQALSFSPALDDRISQICELDPQKITDILFSGINVSDFLEMGNRSAMQTHRECQVVEPVPNMYFMRDPGFVLGNTFFLSRMFRKIRRRETSLMRRLIHNHPHLKYMRDHTMDLDDRTEDAVSIEGGDTMCISDGHYAIAESERTGRAVIRKVAEYLFNNKKAECLYQPLIPPKRAFIHLDTVCSMAGPNAAVVHTEAFSAYSETLLWTPEVIKSGGEPISLGMNFIDVLHHSFNKEIIQAAGGSSRARLEQFDDATNLFMVNPETPMVYDRNTETNKVLEEHGLKPGVFQGSDLVMGRGGARCMTMPLHRD